MARTKGAKLAIRELDRGAFGVYGSYAGMVNSELTYHVPGTAPRIALGAAGIVLALITFSCSRHGAPEGGGASSSDKHTKNDSIRAVSAGAASAVEAGDSAVEKERAADVSGTWHLTETITGATGSAAEEVGEQPSFAVTIAQEGARLGLTGEWGDEVGTWRAVLAGGRARFTATYADDGGTTTESFDFAFSGGRLVGTSTWTWKDDAETCTGQSSWTGRLDRGEAASGGGDVF